MIWNSLGSLLALWCPGIPLSEMTIIAMAAPFFFTKHFCVSVGGSLAAAFPPNFPACAYVAVCYLRSEFAEEGYVHLI